MAIPPNCFREFPMARTSRPLAALAASTAAVGVLASVAAPAQAQSYDPYGRAYGYGYDPDYAQRAQPGYCDRDRGQRQAAGATFGAAIGAVAGSQMAARGRRTEGSVLGGVVGAMIGAGVGSSSSDCRAYDDRHGYDERRYGYGYDQRQPYGYQDRYGRDPYARAGYGYDAYGQDRYGCRTVTVQERDRYGRTVISSREVCDRYGY
jgi:hypothetical protein